MWAKELVKEIEKALCESEARFRAIFEQAPIGMVRMDLEGMPIETNRVFRYLLGYCDNELRNMSFWEFTHRDDVEIDTALFHELILGNSDQYMIKKRYIRKNDTMFWGRVTVSLVRDASGNPQFVICMVEDITERKEAEEKFQLSENKYRTMIENMEDGVIIIQNEKIQYSNDAFSKMTGYEVGDIAGKDIKDFFSSKDMKMITDYFSRQHTSENIPGDHKFKILHRDRNKEIFANINVSHINYQGKLAGMMTLKDVTERLRAEMLIRQSKEFAETVLNSINDPISIINVKDFKIIDTNKAFLTINGLTKEQVIGKKCHEIIYAIDVPCTPYNCPLQETHKSGKSSICEHKNYDINNNIQYKEISTYPILNENEQIVSVVHIERDITERKRTEQELLVKAQLLDNASDFIYVHDLDGNFMYVNEPAYKLHGFKKEEMLRMNFRDILAPEFKYLMDQWIKDVLEKRQAIFESNHINNCNEWIPVEVKSSVVDYMGKKIILSVTRDIILQKQAEIMRKEKARARLQSLIVSALPVFASGAPPNVRDILIKNFSDKFENNVKSRFKDEMEQKDVENDREQFIVAYMTWLSELYLNFGIENKIKNEIKRKTLELINCPWIDEARSNPIFCLICRSLAKRSFTWTGLNGSIEQKSSIVSSSKNCRFEIQVI